MLSGFYENHTEFSFHFHATMYPPLLYPLCRCDRWALVDLVGVLPPVTWQGPWERLLSSLADLKGICVSSAEALRQFLMFPSTAHEGRIKFRPWLRISGAIESNTFCLLPELLQTAAKAVTRMEDRQTESSYSRSKSPQDPFGINDIHLYRLLRLTSLAYNWKSCTPFSSVFNLRCFTLLTMQLSKLYYQKERGRI